MFCYRHIKNNINSLIYFAIFLVYSSLFYSLSAIAQTGRSGKENSPIFISGKITSIYDSVDLLVYFSAHNVTGGFNFESQTFEIKPADKDGKFSIPLNPICEPAQLMIYDKVSYASFFPDEKWFWIEPGDSINIDANIDPKGQLKISFSGKGSSKYNLSQELRKINYSIISTDPNIYNLRNICDSLYNEALGILNSYKKNISDQAYKLIKSDIFGNVYGVAMERYIYTFDSTYILKFSKLKRNTINRDFFEIANQEFPVKDIHLLTRSKPFTAFLYQKEKVKLNLEFKGKRYEFGELFDRFKSKYTGILREKLLAYSLLNLDMYGIFSGCDPDEYTTRLIEAENLIKTKWIKAPVINWMETRGKGVKALDFELPMDSTGQLVRLSDFRGKVILLDLWSYMCSACNSFSKVFHEKVYPTFKDNPDFTVISVMTSNSSRDKYMERLRRLGTTGTTYTFPEYVNLFAGEEVEMGRQLEKHYNIIASPLILLIDRNGLIYSSTIPFFTSSNSKNVGKLIDLINKALADPLN